MNYVESAIPQSKSRVQKACIDCIAWANITAITLKPPWESPPCVTKQLWFTRSLKVLYAVVSGTNMYCKQQILLYTVSPIRWGLHGLNLFVLEIPQMLEWIEILLAELTLWTLRMSLKLFLKFFLFCFFALLHGVLSCWNRALTLGVTEGLFLVCYNDYVLGTICFQETSM